MKPLTFRRSRFRLKKFLAALHEFSPDGNPLLGVSGDILDLAEALSLDLGEEFGGIPDDSLARLELGLPLFGYLLSASRRSWVRSFLIPKRGKP